MLVPSGAPWKTGHEALRAALDAAAASERQRAMEACEAHVMEEVEAAVDGPAWMVISSMPQDLWMQLRGIIKQALKQSITSIDRELAGFGCVLAAPTQSCTLAALACFSLFACFSLSVSRTLPLSQSPADAGLQQRVRIRLHHLVVMYALRQCLMNAPRIWLASVARRCGQKVAG